MKTNKAIPVNDIPELCDCLDNWLSDENSLAFDVGSVESEETKTKIKMFLKGYSYACNGVLDVSENIYSITVKESNTYVDCLYTLEKRGTYESAVHTKKELDLSVDALIRGEKVIIDLSNADDPVGYFHYICGAAFSMNAHLDRVNQDTFIFNTNFIRLPKEQTDIKHAVEEMKKVEKLIETADVLAEAEQIESLYTECIEILDRYGYLTPARLHYSDFLYRIGKSDAALRVLDTFCDLYVNSNAKCSGLFHKVLSKAFQYRIDIGGFEELNAFASKLLLMSNDKNSNISLRILNTAAEILIKNNNSKRAVDLLSKSSIDVNKCYLSVQSDFLFLKALAFYKIGKFGKSEQVLTDLLSQIETEDRTTMNCLEAKRLLASACSMKGKYSKAIKLLEEVLDAVYLKNPEEYFIPFSDESDSSTIYLKDFTLDN